MFCFGLRRRNSKLKEENARLLKLIAARRKEIEELTEVEGKLWEQVRDLGGWHNG